jgi:hypothetical protein
MVTSELAAEAEEDGSEEEASPRRPGESHEVATNVRFLAGGAECITSLDDPSAVTC